MRLTKYSKYLQHPKLFICYVVLLSSFLQPCKYLWNFLSFLFSKNEHILENAIICTSNVVNISAVSQESNIFLVIIQIFCEKNKRFFISWSWNSLVDVHMPYPWTRWQRLWSEKEWLLQSLIKCHFLSLLVSRSCTTIYSCS